MTQADPTQIDMLIGTVGLAVCVLVAVGVALSVAWTALTDEDVKARARERLKARVMWNEPDTASPEDIVERVGALSSGNVFVQAQRRAEQKRDSAKLAAKRLEGQRPRMRW